MPSPRNALNGPGRNRKPRTAIAVPPTNPLTAHRQRLLGGWPSGYRRNSSGSRATGYKANSPSVAHTESSGTEPGRVRVPYTTRAPAAINSGNGAATAMKVQPAQLRGCRETMRTPTPIQTKHSARIATMPALGPSDERLPTAVLVQESLDTRGVTIADDHDAGARDPRVRHLDRNRGHDQDEAHRQDRQADDARSPRSHGLPPSQGSRPHGRIFPAGTGAGRRAFRSLERSGTLTRRVVLASLAVAHARRFDARAPPGYRHHAPSRRSHTMGTILVGTDTTPPPTSRSRTRRGWRGSGEPSCCAVVARSGRACRRRSRPGTRPWSIPRRLGPTIPRGLDHHACRAR